MNTAIKFTENNDSPTNLFEQRSVLLELAHTAMHPSLDAKNRVLASRFLIRQLLERLRDPRAPFSQVKIYLDVFHKVLAMELIKTDLTGHQNAAGGRAGDAPTIAEPTESATTTEQVESTAEINCTQSSEGP